MTSAQASLVLRHVRRLAGTRDPDQPSDGQLLERFTSRRDEAVFAELVQRHGPMVLNVCRSVLRHDQDAEDAFQAAFVVLARKADSIRRQEAVAGWLHEVAHHVAVKAQADAARRRVRERRASEMASADPTLDMTLRDLQRVLHEELQRLPDKYRVPLVLCYLEGRSQEETARHLGWAKSTVRGRLDRGREHLRRRLARRGMALSAVWCAADLALRTPAIKAALMNSVVRAALLSSGDQAASGVVSAQASALAEGVTRAMFRGKVKLVTFVLLAACFLAAGALTHRALAAKETSAPAQKSEAFAKKEGTAQAASAKPADDAKGEEGDVVEVSGRVESPDGKPAAEAKVYFVRNVLGRRTPPPPPALMATTDRDGRFRFQVAKAGYRDPAEQTFWFHTKLTAVAPGFGPAWAAFDKAETLKDVTLRLVKDDVPLQGRVLGLKTTTAEELGPWLKTPQAKGEENPILSSGRLAPEVVGLEKAVVSDADGRFRITGIGRDRVVLLRFEGPAVETRDVYALTRTGPTIRLPLGGGIDGTYALVCYGAAFEHAAAPSKPIVGVVRDKDTGKPLAGVTVQGRVSGINPENVQSMLHVLTDREGRFRLVGLPKGAGHKILAIPAAGQPYLPAAKSSGTSSGLDPVTLNFELKRGVVIRGRILNKATGKPTSAQIEYFAFADNPYLRDAPDFRRSDHVQTLAGEDGSFTLVGLPGRGLLAAKGGQQDHGRFVMGSGADKITGAVRNFNFVTEPHGCMALLFNTVVEINPAEDSASFSTDIMLDPGVTVTGTVLGPDGKPVEGATIDGSWGRSLHVPHLDSAQFTLTGIDAQSPRPFFFSHRAKRLGAAVLIRGDEPKTFTVQLQLCATLTGRIVDEDGVSQPGRTVFGFLEGGQLNLKEGWGGFFSGKTDKEGRFRIDRVMPGVKVTAHVEVGSSLAGLGIKPLSLEPGEIKDLGDLTIKKFE
jgi:RNA polymerase sigma factor (sigma-70 family)